MPYALRESGVFLGLLALTLVAWMTDYSLLILLRSGVICDTNSYQDMMSVAFGKPGFVILSLLQFLHPIIRKH